MKISSYPIFFEGVDKSGKTTLMQKFNEKTDFRHMCFDRGLVSYCAYNDIFKRGFQVTDASDELSELIVSMMENSIFVYAKAQKHIIESRVSLSDHPMYDIDLHQKSFDEMISDLIKNGSHVITVRTDLEPVEGCVNYLIEKIQEYHENKNS